MLLFAATRLIRSAALSCLPIVRLYRTSAAVSGLPSDHFTFDRTPMVSVFPSFDQVKLLPRRLY